MYKTMYDYEYKITESINLIKKIYDGNDNNDITLKRSLSSMLMTFNLFERHFLSDKINGWYNVPNYFTIDDKDIEKEYNFFRNRYVENNNINSKYYSLGVHKDYKDSIKSNLIHNNNKLYTLLTISYCFRNNLYHGVKDINYLYKYISCFDEIYSFLIKVILKAQPTKKLQYI